MDVTASSSIPAPKAPTPALAWPVLISHAVLTGVLVGTLAWLAGRWWFPRPFVDLLDVRKFIDGWMIACATAGPLLTLLTYRPHAKPPAVLRKDLIRIVALQLAVMLIGLYALWSLRPVHLAFEVDRLQVVSRADFTRAELQRADGALREVPWRGVTLIGVSPPQTPQERLRDVDLGLQGREASSMPARWRVLTADDHAQMLRRGQAVAGLMARLTRAERESLQKAVDQSGLPASALKALPVVGHRFKTWTALFDPTDFHVRAFAPLDLFELPKP